ncbi:MAG: glycerophosphodiester phosphodiesterase family protein, partial [Bacillota bacterium]|nr:glycerophosphodiester phosphodiesterase family protein [Bacillota bacterium]
NSLAAFNASKEFGFKIVETDLQLTKDNQWVILHDNTLDRTTNGKGNVENNYLKDIELLKLKSNDNENLTVPTLDEFLRLCSMDGLMPILDIKPNEKQITSKDYIALLSSLDKFHMIEKSIFCSYSKKVLTELRKRDNATTIAVMMKPSQDNLDFARGLDNAFMYCNFKDLTDDDIILIGKNNLKFAIWTVNDEKTAESFLKKGTILVATDILH